MELLDLPDDLLRLITRRCGAADFAPVPLFCTCRRLAAIGYGGVETLAVTAAGSHFVRTYTERSVTPDKSAPISRTANIPYRRVVGLLRRARAVRHLTLRDQSRAVTHDGWNEVDSLEHPLFRRLAVLLDGLPLRSLHCSGGAVHALGGRPGVGVGSLRTLALTDLSWRDDAQQAVVRSVLAAHGGTLTSLRLANLWDTDSAGRRRVAVSQPLAWLRAAGAMHALRSLTLSCLVGRSLAAAIAGQCPGLEALCVDDHAEVLGDGVGAAWAGPTVLPRLTSVSWTASPVDAGFDATAELAALLRGRRLTHLRLQPEDQKQVAGVAFGHPFVTRVLKAMPALPVHCKLHVGTWDEPLMRALLDDTAGEVVAVETLHLSLAYRSGRAVELLGRLPHLRELHLRGSCLPPAAAWSALTRLEVLRVGSIFDRAAELVGGLAASPVRATLRSLTLGSCRVALTRERSGADLARLAALRLLAVTFLFQADFDFIMGAQESAAELRARRRLSGWASRLLPGVSVRVDRFVLGG